MRPFTCVRAVLLVTGLVVTPLLHAEIGDGPSGVASAGGEPASATPWRRNLLPPPLIAFDDVSSAFPGNAASTAASTVEPTLAPPARMALAWAAKAPSLSFGSERVRTLPTFSVVEPVSAAAPTVTPRWLPGGLDSPRALFFFDAPPAVNFAAIQPVPEPGTWALMLAGLGVVALAVRARRGGDESLHAA